MKLNITNFHSSESVLDCPMKNQPEYAFIGRSNVGKSSLINCVVGQKIAYTSSKPGKTQLINHININNSWCLVDLPGYGYAKLSKQKRRKILYKTEEYFQKRGSKLVAVFSLIDIRIPPQKIDLERMTWLVNNNIYFIRVFTKCDSLNNYKIEKNINDYNKEMLKNNWAKMPETIITSSKKKIGKNDILEKIYTLNKLFQNL